MTNPTKPTHPRSVHSASFPQLLDQLGISLAVTTYQACKLILLRSSSEPSGPELRTHSRVFQKPMGLAWEPGRLALGTLAVVWEFHDIPGVARKLPSPESANHHDAAFLPRIAHITGDMQIHEMVWVPSSSPATVNAKQFDPADLSELWFVNTRFSCLSTRSEVYSFIPRWKPPFITVLAPEDRCHLNGLGLRDGKPRYVTALGETNTDGGWRANKRSGGVLIDIPTNQIITRGLSMPHSPRWHDGKLWMLESGNGGVGIVDERTGRYQEICRLPGFTRGISFAGPYAFVGLSQVRETAIFSGIAIAEAPQEERNCGVWAIDTRNGQIMGFVKFTEAVEEIFAVQVLPGIRWPDVHSEDAVRIAESYELPDAALNDVPSELRG